MHCKKNRRTLICYAGSASEASIGSKPLGSELVTFIYVLRVRSQQFVDLLIFPEASASAQTPNWI